jgi:hypothetical protein
VTTLKEVPEEEGLKPEEKAAPTPSKAPKKSGNDVRKELRDYLTHVKEKLEEPPKKAKGPGELLDYLEKLSEYLPERYKRKFRASDERLTLEMLKKRLAGYRGLREKIADTYRPAAPVKKETLTPSRVVDTFSYLKDLSAWHPDKKIGAAMKERIDSLIARVGGVR